MKFLNALQEDAVKNFSYLGPMYIVNMGGGGGGQSLPVSRGRLSPHPLPIDQYPLEGHSETSNGQALLNPFYHYIKMKTYMRVGGGGHFTPG